MGMNIFFIRDQQLDCRRILLICAMSSQPAFSLCSILLRLYHMLVSTSPWRATPTREEEVWLGYHICPSSPERLEIPRRLSAYLCMLNLLRVRGDGEGTYTFDLGRLPRGDYDPLCSAQPVWLRYMTWIALSLSQQLCIAIAGFSSFKKSNIEGRLLWAQTPRFASLLCINSSCMIQSSVSPEFIKLFAITPDGMR